MMNKLKYGTLVLAGLATIGGFYYETTPRFQVYAKDYIEIVEGVREREYIYTNVLGTNSISIQIATNRLAMQELDTAISNMIPYFVNQTRIDEWLTTTNREPFHWTYADLKAAIGFDLGKYPYQINERDLRIRFDYLKTLIYTDDTCAWTGSMKTTKRVPSSGTSLAYDNNTTNFYVSEWSQPYVTNLPSAVSWWNTNAVPFETMLGYTWNDCYSYTNWTTIYIDYDNIYSTSTTYPLYYWQNSASFDVMVIKEATLFYHYLYGHIWGIDIGHQANCNWWWSSEFVKSKMNGSSKGLDLTRTDTFYDTFQMVQETNVTSNITSVVTSVYILPPVFLDTFDKHTEYGDCAFPDDGDPSYFRDDNTYKYIYYNSTNRYYNSYSSGGSSNVIPRNVIHKWDVTRCRP